MDEIKEKTRKMILTIITIGLAVISIISFVGYNKFIERDFVTYQEQNSIDYTVCFKQPNDFYTEECLPENINNYVTKYINYINVNFDYHLKLNKDVDTTYKYRVDALLTLSDRNNTSSIMNEKRYVLVKEKEISKENVDEIKLSELVRLSYDEYNDFVIDYKNSSNVQAAANIKVTLHVEAVNKQQYVSKAINTKQDIVINIPLDERTIQLDTDYKATANGTPVETDASKANINIIFLVIACISGAGALIVLVTLLVMIKIKNRKKPIYERFINELKNEYDSDITNISSLIDNEEENTYEYLDVQSFKELYEIIKTSTDKKIIWNEKNYYDNHGHVNNRISWFFIFVTDKKVMRFIVNEKELTEKYNSDPDALNKYRGKI